MFLLLAVLCLTVPAMKLSSWGILFLVPGVSLATVINSTGSVIATENATTTAGNGSSVPNPSAFATAVQVNLQRDHHCPPPSNCMLTPPQNTGTFSLAPWQQPPSILPWKLHPFPPANWFPRLLSTIRLSPPVTKLPWSPRMRVGNFPPGFSGQLHLQHTKLKALHRRKAVDRLFGMSSRIEPRI